MKIKTLILFIIMNCLLSIRSIYSQSDSLSGGEFKKWHIMIGYSINNKNIFNIEGSYNIPLSKVFMLSFDTRFYSFLTLAPSLVTQPIIISGKWSFSAKAGLGIMFFGPVAGFGDIATEWGAIVRYKINKKYNLTFSYKQMHKNSMYTSFESFPSRQVVKNFPIRFLSIGLEF